MLYQAIRRFEDEGVGPSAESVSRTHMACSSDRCLDHLGYLGKRYIIALNKELAKSIEKLTQVFSK